MKKEITYINFLGIATRCTIHYEENVGLTILDKDDPEHFLLCVQGGLSPQISYASDEDKEKADQLIAWILLQIESSDKLSIADVKEKNYQLGFYQGIGGGAGPETCAFNQ